MLEKNPFAYGRILRPEDSACTRADLEKKILRVFIDRERLALFGDRRLGKSTLINRTLALHKHSLIAIDLLGLKSIDGLCAAIAAAIEDYVRERSLLVRKVSPWLREIGVEIREMKLTLTGGPLRVELSRTRSTETLRSLLGHIEQLSRREPLAVFFDEFQEIPSRLTKEDARHVLGVLRSTTQRHSRVAYYFAGSAQASFTAMFTHEGAPFFEGAQLLEMKPIPNEVFGAFLKDQFKVSHRPATAQAIEAILTLAGQRTADVQQLAHESWYAATQTPIDSTSVARGLLKIVSNLESTGLALLSRATELQQRALITAAFFEESQETQARIAEIGRFRSSSAYLKALAPFLEDETPPLERTGEGRIRFRHRYLRLWYLLQYTRASYLLPILRDAAYYRELLPTEVHLILSV